MCGTHVDRAGSHSEEEIRQREENEREKMVYTSHHAAVTILPSTPHGAHMPRPRAKRRQGKAREEKEREAKIIEALEKKKRREKQKNKINGRNLRFEMRDHHCAIMSPTRNQKKRGVEIPTRKKQRHGAPRWRKKPLWYAHACFGQTP